MGVAVTVDNRPGAGGRIAAEMAARATSDDAPGQFATALRDEIAVIRSLRVGGNAASR